MTLTFFKSIALILTGTICGFFSSSPPGPINLLVADSVLNERPLHRSAFIGGVILAELALAALAFWGFREFLQGPVFDRWIPVVGGGFVAGLGIIGFFSRAGKRDPAREQKRGAGRKRSGAFLQGLFLCGSNPAFLLFWIYVMSAVNYMRLSEGVPFSNLFILVGIAIGNALWFTLFLRVLHKGAGRMGENPIPWLRKGISLILILLGLSGIYIHL